MGTTTGDDLDRWIARLRAIPDEHRELTVGPAQAEREFGVDGELAEELTRRGLPCARGDDGPLLWSSDLQYIGLRLGCARLYEGALNRWVGALTAFSARAATPLAIRCTAYAPPGTTIELLAPDGQRVRAKAGPRGSSPLGFEATMRGDVSLPAELERALAELLADIAGYDFCWLWPPLETDLAFARRTRLANCRSAAGVLVEEAPRLGVEARLAYGLLVAPPYSTPHNWSEVRAEDGSWVPLDPLLLSLLKRFSELDAADWPPHRSPGAILLRLADPGTPLVTAVETGTPLQATFLTRATDAA